jgi:peptide deformylase
MSQKQVLTLWSGETLNEAEARILRTSCAEVPFPLDAAAQRDVEALIEAFIAREDALGLAAPQIGISRRIVVYRNKGFDDKSTWTKDEKDYDLLINPRITQARGELVYMEEGCLSCPEIQVEVGRFPEIKIRALNIKGQKINKRYADFPARVAQHELDHLDGKLIVDHEGALSYPKTRSAFFKKVFQNY